MDILICFFSLDALLLKLYYNNLKAGFPDHLHRGWVFLAEIDFEWLPCKF